MSRLPETYLQTNQRSEVRSESYMQRHFAYALTNSLRDGGLQDTSTRTLAHLHTRTVGDPPPARHVPNLPLQGPRHAVLAFMAAAATGSTLMSPYRYTTVHTNMHTTAMLMRLARHRHRQDSWAGVCFRKAEKARNQKCRE
jgi:hypothetical protein